MNQSLSIGMMARSYIPAPIPEDLIYAPISHMIQLAKGLADKGHKITIFSPLGSKLQYPNITIETLNLKPFASSGAEFEKFLANTPLLAHSLDSLQDWYMAQAMFEQASESKFDLLHFHAPEIGLPIARNYLDIPTLYTLHDPLTSQMVQIYKQHLTPNQKFIAISHQQASQATSLPIKAVIHHGVITPPVNSDIIPDNSLLFVGRIIPEKGVKEAIYVAQKANRDLVIIGPTLPSSQGYFDSEIAPHLNQHIRYLGQVNRSDLAQFYQRASAVLTPVQWDEPFGLTTIEAMSNGAPVISLNRGAAPEIIADQQTGYIVNNLEEMIKVIDTIPALSRQKCRQHILENFPVSKMVDATEAVFKEAVMCN